MRSILFIFALGAVFASIIGPVMATAADPPESPTRPDCDSRPNAYMRVECRVIIDPAFDQKWRRMTPSEMQDAVDADPCVGFFSNDLEKRCRAELKKYK
jgi:hypothetical protein